VEPERADHVRAVFFKVTGIDLDNLELEEVRGLIQLLPEVQMYLFHTYNMKVVWEPDDEDDEDEQSDDA
jgi:hypothetical protein